MDDDAAWMEYTEHETLTNKLTNLFEDFNKFLQRSLTTEEYSERAACRFVCDEVFCRPLRETPLARPD